jgi:serine phosphatase RsbU (regulator of sigma subunit)
MAKRSGFGISAKMILTSTLLVVLTITGLGLMSIAAVGDAYDTIAREKIDGFREAIEHRGRTTIQILAQAMLADLTNNADDDIKLVIARTVTQDPEIELIYVLSRDKRMVAYCRIYRRAARICDPDPHRGAFGAVGLPEIQDLSWKRVEQIWRSRKATGAADALVSFELDDEHGPAQVFAYPVFSGGEAPTPAAALDLEPGENRQGYVVLAYGLDPIERFTAEGQARTTSARRSVLLRTLALGALFALIGMVLALFHGLSMSRRLETLAWKVDRIARGDVEARVAGASSDEIGALADTLDVMEDRLALLLRETRDKANLDRELEVARAIQELLVPPNEPVDCDLFNFAGFFQPASQRGGDWWNYHLLENHRLLLVIGEVSGHGVPAAMIAAAAKASCGVTRAIRDDDVAVTTLLEIMNGAVHDAAGQAARRGARRRYVMTCFAAIIDLESRVITYANAGHHFPYLYRVGEDGRGEFGSLMSRGNRLGELRESRYESTSTQLRPGDTLIWYTDGIVACESLAGEEYGEKRFRASIRRAAHLGAGDLRNALVSDAMSFYGEAPRRDDITLIVGRVT